MKKISSEKEWPFVDFYTSLKEFDGPELWTIPGDPHPNALAHKLMTEQLVPIIKSK